MDKRIVDSIISFLEEKGKLSLLPEIIAGLKKELEKRENMAVIVSAKGLTAQEEKEADIAAKKYFGEDIAVKKTIDPLILGGLVFKYKDTIIDESFANKLAKIADELNG